MKKGVAPAVVVVVLQSTRQCDFGDSGRDVSELLSGFVLEDPDAPRVSATCVKSPPYVVPSGDPVVLKVVGFARDARDE